MDRKPGQTWSTVRLRPAPASYKFTAPIPNDPDGRCVADALLIGNDYSPGVCTVSKAGRTLTWDKQKGFGFDGAHMRFIGEELSEFDISWTLWRFDHVIAWDDWYKKYLAPPFTQKQQNGAFLANAPSPKTLAVSHPILADAGISQIVPLKIQQWDLGTGAGHGKITRTISFSSYKEPKPALGTVKAGIPKAPPATPTAEDAQDIIIKNKLALVAANGQSRASNRKPKSSAQ